MTLTRCMVLSIVLVTLSLSKVSAQTLIEEVELPEPVLLQSGVPIPDLEDAARRAINTDNAEQSQSHFNYGVKEYQLGTTTIKEYRDDSHLMYLEAISETGSTYVWDSSHAREPESRKSRSGIIVSTW